MKLWCAVSALTVLLTGIPTVSAQTQGQWTSTGAMQSTRELGAQVLLGSGNVLTIGGIDNSSNVLASAEVYRPGPGKWKAAGSMIQARQLFSAVVLKSGKVLVAGGLGTSNIVLSGAELYDPSTGTWSGVGSLSVPRFDHTATLLPSGKVLVTGGCTSSSCSTNTAVSELFDPTTNKWSATGNLNTARSYHTAVLLQTGKVLVVGGYGGLTSCELYNPSTGTWSSAASTNTGRYLNTTTLLSDGKVLVTGGASGRYPITSAEIYDPTANTWTATGSMTIGRYGHTATLLPDGTVVAAGGIGQPISCGKACTSYIPTAKVDIYNEATGKFTATGLLSRSRAYQTTTLLGTRSRLGGRRPWYYQHVLRGLEQCGVLYPTVADVFSLHSELRLPAGRVDQRCSDGNGQQRQQSLRDLYQHRGFRRLQREQQLPGHPYHEPELLDHRGFRADRGRTQERSHHA